MEQPPILVVGPGAMGGLLAALLSEAGLPVVLVDRDPERAARLSDGGLVVNGPAGGMTRLVEVSVQAPPLQLAAEPELAFLCVKAGDTAAALAPLAQWSMTWAVVQNGLGRVETVANTIGSPERVVGVVTTEGATRLGEGRIVHAGRGETRVGPVVAEGQARAERVREVLALAGLEVTLEADLRRIIWEKLQVNAAINALAALERRPNGVLLESSTLGSLADSLAVEVAAVAFAKGVPGDWSEDAAKARWRAVAEATRHNLCSTLQDLNRGQKTEVFAINGAVAKAGRELGVSVVVNGVLARLVEAREELLVGDSSPS